jgi:hypothetical protein
MYNFKLYYPEGDEGEGGPPLAGGGGEGEESEEPDGRDYGPGVYTGPLHGGLDGGLQGVNWSDTSINPRDPKEKRKRAIIRGGTIPPSPAKRVKSKVIKTLTFNGEEYYGDQIISPAGESGAIKITGTPGSIFSLTIEDSSGCSILKKEIEFEEISNSSVYILNQQFPSIKSDDGSYSVSKKTYTVKLTPAATTYLDEVYFGAYGGRGEATFNVVQYADPTLTFTNTIDNTFTVAGDDVSRSGPANRIISDSTNYSDLTHTMQVRYTSHEGGGKRLYVKNNSFTDNVVKSNVVKAKVVDCEDGYEGAEYYFSGTTTTATKTTIEGGTEIISDIPEGCLVKWDVTHTKTVVASVDEDGNVLNYDTCKNQRTNRFKVNNTNDIRPGMRVTGGGIHSSVHSIGDCGEIITLYNSYIIPKDTVLTFKHRGRSAALSVSKEVSPGKTLVILGSTQRIPNGTEVTFDNSSCGVTGRLSFQNSGNTGNGTSNAVTVTSTISTSSFGTEDITYTLDLDGIITNKPNAFDQKAIVSKNSSGYAINMINGDYDINASSKTGTVVRTPSHGTVGSYNSSNDTFTYTPNTGYTGNDIFTFTMSDGVNSSEEKTVKIKVI